MYTYIYVCIYIYIYIYIHIYTIFVNAVPAAFRGPDDPDLARCSGLIKNAQTLARQWFWSVFNIHNRTILECRTDAFPS